MLAACLQHAMIMAEDGKGLHHNVDIADAR